MMMCPLCGGELFSYFSALETFFFCFDFGLDLFVVSGRRVPVLLRLLLRVLLWLQSRVLP